MPFLHWDLENFRYKREIIVKDLDDQRSKDLDDLKNKRKTVVGVEAASDEDASDDDWNDEQKLLRAYLTNDHPLHIRRTLDQYYYHTLADTSQRDKDQVVSRYQASSDLEPKIITMVDQLWVWVLSGANGQPDTVVTCFPHVGNALEGETDPDPDPDEFTSVLRRIKRYLLDMPFRIQTAYDLAGLIAATCSRIYLDPGSTLSFQDGRRREHLRGD